MASPAPTPVRPTGQRADPGLVRMLGRASLRRCPWCGDWKAWFTGWLGKRDRCRRCGLRWDRNTEGQELGSMVVNLVLVIVLLAAAAGVVLTITYPEVYVAPMVIAFVVLGCLVPIVIYPIGFTIWHAIDLRVRPPRADELADAEAYLASTGMLVEDPQPSS